MDAPATADVVVIGSGITGAATAAELARRGASVVLVEKEDGPAKEGSGRAQGSLRVQGRHAAEAHIAAEALSLWREAADEADIEFVAGGNLYFATSASELPVLRQLASEAREAGLSEVQVLEPDAVRDLVPAAAGPFLAAMYSPADAQCQPEKGTRLYARRAERAGVSLRYGTKVIRLLVRGDDVAGVETTRGVIHAPVVVAATGVWTSYLAATAGLKVPIMPVIMSELETAPMEPLFRETVRAFGFGARQRPHGSVVVSAGLNARVYHRASLYDLRGLRYWLPRAAAFRKNLKLGLDAALIWRQVAYRSALDTRLVPDRSPEPAVDRGTVHEALTRMSAVMPAMSQTTVARCWGGAVDMTPDGLPIIDSGSGPAGLVLVAGLCGHGFTLGPALGEIAADLALGRGSRIPVDGLSLQRFTNGKVGRPQMLI